MKAFPPDKILVAYDFSPGAAQAWRYARMLAKRLNSRLEAVYVSPWSFVPDGGSLAVPPLSRKDAAALESKLRRRLGTAAVRVGEGDVVGEILRAAKDCGAGLLIMATHGRGALARALIGSVTEAVVRRSPVPVLSLRRAAPTPRAILAPVNLQPYSMAGFHAAEAAAAALGARITLLHVRDASSDDSALIRAALAADASRAVLGSRVEAKVVDGDPVRRIVEESRRHDLVVLVAHKRGLWKDALLGTTAEQVLRRCAAPVLCVPAGAAGRPSVRRRRGSSRLPRRSGRTRRAAAATTTIKF